MTKQAYENASERKSYVGTVFTEGEKLIKKKVLDSLPKTWAKLHNDGKIHIHDLEAYGLTYNCLTFNLLNKFPYETIKKLINDSGRIIAVFDYLKDIISKMGNEQSGGMSFANFDTDLCVVFSKVIDIVNKMNLQLIRDCICSFIQWCNNSHERMGKVSFYVTLNIGLGTKKLAQYICECVIDEFYKTDITCIKPNIIFKVKAGINRFESDPNRCLFEKSMICTAKKMIPTYLICDSKTNVDINANKLAIMGCRTRVVQNEFGENSSIGRGNIDYITINLPRIALEVVGEEHSDKLAIFKDKWIKTAEVVKDILLDRYKKLIARDKTDFPTNIAYDLWCEDFSKDNSLEDIFKNGTYSIGFMGLSEAMEVLTGEKYYKSAKSTQQALELVKFMREYVDDLRKEYKMNFSLLATSGELICGRFPSIDKKFFENAITDKEFYTNSFHIEVDSEISPFEKIGLEGEFHSLCNGGCITYVELKSSPLSNSEGINELIECAVASGTSYLGINFPLDICKSCGGVGVFDKCEYCGSDKITRIRRVSGYLEILDYFTLGKKAEVKTRKPN